MNRILVTIVPTIVMTAATAALKHQHHQQQKQRTPAPTEVLIWHGMTLGRGGNELLGAWHSTSRAHHLRRAFLIFPPMVRIVHWICCCLCNTIQCKPLLSLQLSFQFWQVLEVYMYKKCCCTHPHTPASSLLNQCGLAWGKEITLKKK